MGLNGFKTFVSDILIKCFKYKSQFGNSNKAIHCTTRLINLVVLKKCNFCIVFVMLNYGNCYLPEIGKWFAEFHALGSSNGYYML